MSQKSCPKNIESKTYLVQIDTVFNNNFNNIIFDPKILDDNTFINSAIVPKNIIVKSESNQQTIESIIKYIEMIYTILDKYNQLVLYCFCNHTLSLCNNFLNKDVLINYDSMLKNIKQSVIQKKFCWIYPFVIHMIKNSELKHLETIQQYSFIKTSLEPISSTTYEYFLQVLTFIDQKDLKEILDTVIDHVSNIFSKVNIPHDLILFSGLYSPFILKNDHFSSVEFLPTSLDPITEIRKLKSNDPKRFTIKKDSNILLTNVFTNSDKLEFVINNTTSFKQNCNQTILIDNIVSTEMLFFESV